MFIFALHWVFCHITYCHIALCFVWVWLDIVQVDTHHVTCNDDVILKHYIIFCGVVFHILCISLILRYARTVQNVRSRVEHTKLMTTSMRQCVSPDFKYIHILLCIATCMQYRTCKWERLKHSYLLVFACYLLE